MGDSPILVGIAGLGRSGWDIHAKTIGTLPEQFRVAAVFDPDAARRKEAKEKAGAKTCDSFDALIRDPKPEVIVVASPNNYHVTHSLAALDAGKHVVCEKPMAPDLAEANRMVEGAAKRKPLFAVFQNYRFQPDVLKVREVIDSGILGEIKLIAMRWNGFGRRWDWQTLKKNGGGTLNNMGPHMLDCALQLFGDVDPERVFADLQRMLTSGDAEDHYKIVIAAKGHPVIDMESSYGVAYGGDHWNVSGTRGGLRGSTDRLEWKSFDPKKFSAPPVDETPTADRSYNRMPIEFTEGSWSLPADAPTHNQGFYRALYETLRNGKAFPIRVESVYRQMKLIADAKKQSPV